MDIESNEFASSYQKSTIKRYCCWPWWSCDRNRIRVLSCEYLWLSSYQGRRKVQRVYQLAKMLASKGEHRYRRWPVMEAANGAKKVVAKAVLLAFISNFRLKQIQTHLDVKHHQDVSHLVWLFMRISHAVVITPGGIGTLLELFYTWQLMQVDHISRPTVLMGDMWKGLMDWLEEHPVANQLMDQKIW